MNILKYIKKISERDFLPPLLSCVGNNNFVTAFDFKGLEFLSLLRYKKIPRSTHKMR